MRETAVFPLPV